MKHSELIRQIRELLSDPKHWAQGAYAMSRSGEIVEPSSDAAVCWCASGATHRVLEEYGYDKFHRREFIFDKIETYLWRYNTGYFILSQWNDSPLRTHSDVLEFFDYAYEQAVKEEANEGL